MKSIQEIRAALHCWCGDEEKALLDEAIDELEQLRNRPRGIGDGDIHALFNERDALRAETERLREELADALQGASAEAKEADRLREAIRVKDEALKHAILRFKRTKEKTLAPKKLHLFRQVPFVGPPPDGDEAEWEIGQLRKNLRLERELSANCIAERDAAIKGRDELKEHVAWVEESRLEAIQVRDHMWSVMDAWERRHSRLLKAAIRYRKQRNEAVKERKRRGDWELIASVQSDKLQDALEQIADLKAGRVPVHDADCSSLDPSCFYQADCDCGGGYVTEEDRQYELKRAQELRASAEAQTQSLIHENERLRERNAELGKHFDGYVAVTQECEDPRYLGWSGPDVWRAERAELKRLRKECPECWCKTSPAVLGSHRCIK